MKKPIKIETSVWRRLRALSKPERTECLLALCDLEETFGQPHVHGGISIRKLTPKTFECRGNLALRFIFRDEPDALRITHLADHDEIRRMLRSRQFD